MKEGKKHNLTECATLPILRHNLTECATLQILGHNLTECLFIGEVMRLACYPQVFCGILFIK